MTNTVEDTNISRRKALFLGGTAAVVGGAALSSCTFSPQTVLPAVIDAVIGVMTPVCQVIPGIVTLVDIIAKAFPAAVGVSTITDAVAQEIAKYVCSLFSASGVVPGQTPPASGKLAADVNGINVDLHGWTIVNGKIVHF